MAPQVPNVPAAPAAPAAPVVLAPPVVPPATSKISAATTLITDLAAAYAKFEASLFGLLVAYVDKYNFTWHPVPAMIAIGAALAVLGVPNKPRTPSA
jgi:hypothetical protein